MSRYIYIDSDVFDCLEKRATRSDEIRVLYDMLYTELKKPNTFVPYSNAHLSDLGRGYRNDPSFIQGHLNIRSEISKGLCIVQYWGHEQVTWHYRDIQEFFHSALEEYDTYTVSLLSLCLRHNAIPISKLIEYKQQPLPQNFKSFCNSNPIFKTIFARANAEGNFWALCEDIYEIYRLSLKDYSVYKRLRSYVNEAQVKLKLPRQSFKEIRTLMDAPPNFLALVDGAWEQHNARTKVSDNVNYQNFTSLYAKIDFLGRRKDEKFPNMIDDSIHAFYGGHCDIFISNDSKCRDKAKEVYSKLKIATMVYDSKEFVETLPASA